MPRELHQRLPVGSIKAFGSDNISLNRAQRYRHNTPGPALLRRPVSVYFPLVLVAMFALWPMLTLPALAQSGIGIAPSLGYEFGAPLLLRRDSGKVNSLGVDGSGVSQSHTFLDWCPTSPRFASWQRVAVVAGGRGCPLGFQLHFLPLPPLHRGFHQRQLDPNNAPVYGSWDLGIGADFGPSWCFHWGRKPANNGPVGNVAICRRCGRNRGHPLPRFHHLPQWPAKPLGPAPPRCNLPANPCRNPSGT
ncbi:MAG: hypothetical protein UZ07_CHB004000960 [Chlorobi bacterium OLB7]|nr:MAG: hypothetical protein UZ07_CHB004000960 [Chlorobi bacterium OLB7]